MADLSMTLLDYLRNVGMEDDLDFLRESVRILSQLVIEAEAEQQIGAGRYERSADRKTQRNGYRDRTWETRVGEIPLRIPKLRQGTFFPSLLEPRKRSEKALLAVVQSAYVQGVSTRKVDDLLQGLGLTGIDKSKVSRICKQLDDVVVPFRERVLEGDHPYVWLDAVYLKVRQHHRIVSMALVIAIGVRSTGEREILGFELGSSEESAFWQGFLRNLIARGLSGVQMVISDAHHGLKDAIAKSFTGTAWQRCRVHFMRNVLTHISKANRSMVASALRTVFAQPDRQSASDQLHLVADGLDQHWPKAGQVVRDAEDDVLAYMSFPVEHWTRIYSTNPLERLNREVKRRTDVVGVFPDLPSVTRLVGAVLMEVDDEWQVGKRYFSLTSMQRLKEPRPEPSLERVPLRLAPVH